MPDNENIRDHRDYEEPPRPQPRSRSTGSGSSDAGKVAGISILVIALVGGGLLLALICGGILIGLLIPAVQKVRGAAERAKASNNLKQISIGLINCADSNQGKLPLAAIKTKDGKPGLSWRVAILPYLNENPLFKQFKLDEPWDSPNNIGLLDAMPNYYSHPGAPGGNLTHYRVFVGNGALFDFDKQLRYPASITDGTANTILVVEAADSVPWTKPDELTFQPNGALPALGLPGHDYIMVAMADGSVRSVSKKASANSWKAAITCAGNDTPGPDFGP